MGLFLQCSNVISESNVITFLRHVFQVDKKVHEINIRSSTIAFHFFVKIAVVQLQWAMRIEMILQLLDQSTANQRHLRGSNTP